VILVNFKIFLVGNRVDLEKIEKTWPLRMVITDNYRVKNSGKESIKKNKCNNNRIQTLT